MRSPSLKFLGQMAAVATVIHLGCSGGTGHSKPGSGGSTSTLGGSHAGSQSTVGGTTGMASSPTSTGGAAEAGRTGSGGSSVVTTGGKGGATSVQGGKSGGTSQTGTASSALGGKTTGTSAQGGQGGRTSSPAGSTPDAGADKSDAPKSADANDKPTGQDSGTSSEPCPYECTDFCLNAGGTIKPGTCSKSGYVCCNIEASPAGDATGTQYYFDSKNGDDNNDGTSEAKAWKSLTKIKASGIFNLRRGSVWETTGAINLTNSTMRPYGTGPRPVINGKKIVVPQSLATVVLKGKSVLDAVKVSSDAGFGAYINGDGNEIRNIEVDGTGTGALMGIGIAGSNNKVTRCYVHDLTQNTGDTGDVNSSGGAEGIVSFAGSHIDVGYNTVARAHCVNKTLGGDEGGCTEIIMNPLFGLTMEDIQYHHNLCIDTVGLFESCQGTGEPGFDPTKKPGTIKDVTVAYNVVIDSKWMYLAQIVNTIHKNVVFEHNSIIHGPRNNTQWSKDAMSHYYMFGMMFSSSNGTTVSDSLTADQIIDRNNLFVEPTSKESLFIGYTAGHSNNLFAPSAVNLESRWKLDATEQKVDDMGLVDVFHLSSKSAAIDKASTAGKYTTDFYGNAPCGAGPDIGAVEYCPEAASKARSDEVAKYLELNAK